MSTIPTTVTRSKVLEPGEQFTLPPGATIINVTDASGLTSTCDEELPEMEFGCASFYWETTDIMFGDAYFSKIIIDTLEYTIPDPVGFGDPQYESGGSEGEKVAQAITAIENSLVTVVGFDQEDGAKRAVKLRYPIINGAIPKMRLVNPSGYGNIQMDLIGSVDESCAVPSGWYIGDDSDNGTEP